MSSSIAPPAARPGSGDGEPPPELAGLGELWRRLRGGTYPAFAASRPADLGFRDEEALADWPGDWLAPLGDVRRDDWQAGEPDAAIEKLAARMRSRRPFLATVLFAPDVTLARLRRSRSSGGEGLVDAWTGMCWTAEAAWRTVTADSPGRPAGAALLRPLAARLRFLVLSEPMRWRGERDTAWWGWPQDQEFGGDGIMDRVLGPDSWPLLVERCREARRGWQGCLDAYQSHPLLSQAQPRQLERELATLVFRHYEPGFARAGAPLGLPAVAVDQPAPLTAEDRAFIVDVTDRHLLPRFALRTVARLGLFDDSPRLRLARKVVAAGAVAAGAAAVGCAAALLMLPAAILAAVCYLLIGTGVALFPAQWGAMWLLRMPAAAAVGIIALTGLLPGAWVSTSPRGWLAAGTLVAVAYGYLLAEVRNHGVAPGAALARAAAVVAVGAVHAALVSVIALEVVVPAFVTGGKTLLEIWHQPGYGHAGMALALVTAWCLAVGVFSQILWDDRPITATLAHLSWRR